MLDSNGSVTVEQAVMDVGYFEVEVADMGVFFHAWPTVEAAVSTANGRISLDPTKIAPQSSAGRAPGWPGNSRELVQHGEGETVTGFYITDSRPSSAILKVESEHAEDDHVAREMLWITAISVSYAPTLVIHDDYLAVKATRAIVEDPLSSSN